MITFEGVQRSNNNERAVLTEEQARKAQLLAAYELLDVRGKQLLMAMAGTMARLRTIPE
jgi:hypothetical protein